MKISCTPISYSASIKAGKTQDDYFRLIAQSGAEGSDLLDVEAYPWFWQDFEIQVRSVVQRMNSFGLALSAYATGNNFVTTDPEMFRMMLLRVKKVIVTAAELGAPCLRVFGGYYEDCGGEKGVSYKDAMEMVARAFDELVPVAEQEGVVLALENHGRLPGLSAEMDYLCRRYDSKSFRVTFDVANFLANNMDESEDPLKAYEVLKDRIAHVHVKSFQAAPSETGRRLVGAVAGEGYMVPLRQFMYRLQRDHYVGYCSLEYEADRYTPEEQGVPASLRKLLEMKQAAELVIG